VVYGVLYEEYYIVFPHAINIILCMIQLTLYLNYKKKCPINLDEYTSVLEDDNNTNEVSLIEETDDNKLMDISISDLNLSTRAYNVLNAKYKNLYELSHITIEDLLETRELG
jgi:DNA-directed RNA polymerase alpha subunit